MDSNVNYVPSKKSKTFNFNVREVGSSLWCNAQLLVGFYENRAGNYCINLRTVDLDPWIGKKTKCTTKNNLRVVVSLHLHPMKKTCKPGPDASKFTLLIAIIYTPKKVVKGVDLGVAVTTKVRSGSREFPGSFKKRLGNSGKKEVIQSVTLGMKDMKKNLDVMFEICACYHWAVIKKKNVARPTILDE